MNENLSYNVRVWEINRVTRARGYSYRVRWSVDGKRRARSFSTRKLAESFRAVLLAAARGGEGFNQETFLPPRMSAPADEETTWFSHAVAFMDMKWDESSPRHRKSTAEGLITLTTALVLEGRKAPDPEAMRHALRYWAFNVAARRATTEPPEKLADELRWIEENSMPLSDVATNDGVRLALKAIGTTLDGKAAAAATLHRKRAALSGALRYAVEQGHLTSNPLPQVRTKRQPRAETLDTRVVANPDQARALLKAVRELCPPLHAFFACLYYAGPRPAEVRNLKAHDCHLPEQGWGELVLHRGYQESGAAWTNSGERGEERELKHRHDKDTRRVPAHPELVKALREHIAEFGTGSQGRLFVTRTGRGGHPISPPYGNPVSMSTVYRVWAAARARALTAEQHASPLAKRPYDLRHACVSTWLSAGVPATQVAAWAGHSVAVLLRVYAACLDGQEIAAMKRIEQSLRPSHGPCDGDPGREQP